MCTSGCAVGVLIGGMAENARRDSNKDVEAEYLGLEGKSFAVIVNADRVIQSEYPAVVARVCMEVSERLAKQTNASGYIPGQRLLQYQFDHPRWTMMSPSELGKALGVQRLVYVDLTDYRLTDPGNSYIWKGIARANVGVAEIDGQLPDDLVSRKPIMVKFPDKDGYGRDDEGMSAGLVNSALSKRLIDRVSWLFYKHEEKYYPEY